MNDIQIRIAAALEKGDFAAAQSEVEKLKAAGTDSLNQTTAASGKIAQANEQIKGSAGAAVGAMSALSMLMAGNIAGAIRQLVAQTAQLGGSFKTLASQISGPAIAGAIGFALGSMLDKLLGISGAISRSLVPAIASMKEGWDRAFTSADKLANLRLGRLRKEIQDVVDALNQTTKETNLEKRLADRERAARAQADIAQIESATPVGPERDRAVLARRRQAEEEQRRADEAALTTLDAAQKKAAARLAELQANSQRDIATEQAKTQALIDRARSAKDKDSTTYAWSGSLALQDIVDKQTEPSPVWKALGDQRRRLERLQQQYAAEEKRITEELARIQEQQAETRSGITVRSYDTTAEAARGTSAESSITARERAEQAERRRAALQAELDATKAQLRDLGVNPDAAAPAALAAAPGQAQPAQRREAPPTPAAALEATEPPAALLARRVAAGPTRVDQRLGRAPAAPAEQPVQPGPPPPEFNMPTPARDELAAFQASRELDGRRMSERSRAYQDHLAALQQAAEREAEQQAAAVAQITSTINAMAARYAELKAQLKTQEDW